MDMNPEHLRFFREQQGMTREQFAAYLGDCTASTINKWERGINPIPSWVADKMFAKLPITFTVQELSELYDLCREEGFTMSELIQEAVRILIARHKAAKSLGPLYFQTQSQAQPKAAEDPRDYKTED